MNTLISRVISNSTTNNSSGIPRGRKRDVHITLVAGIKQRRALTKIGGQADTKLASKGSELRAMFINSQCKSNYE